MFLVFDFGLNSQDSITISMFVMLPVRLNVFKLVEHNVFMEDRSTRGVCCQEGSTGLHEAGEVCYSVLTVERAPF